MIILGLNAYHGDSAASLVIDGVLSCAIEEERIRRVKHWAGLPTEATAWCLAYAGIGIEDVDFIAVSRDPSAHIFNKILRVLKKSPSLSFLKSRLGNVSRLGDIKAGIAARFGLSPDDLKAKVVNVEHHRAHLASAFFVSPFDDAVCISVDGFGDFVSTMRGFGKGGHIEIDDFILFPHSLGVFYTAATQFLGFHKYGDEYKVMGLSAAGRPTYLEDMRRVVKLKSGGRFELDTSFFLHAGEGVNMVWDNGEPEVGSLYSERFTGLFGPPRSRDEEITCRHRDLAASVQAVYEETLFHILNAAYKKYGCERIALAGGCLQNSLANGKIRQSTPFRDIYIPPAAHDAGTAVGAAIYVWNGLSAGQRAFRMESPYWGPFFGPKDVEAALAAFSDKLESEGCVTSMLDDETALCDKTAGAIAAGKIAGWFQGRTEWGPRALGNRSILVDPRRADMKDVLNERIKRREGFRPFAPSVLEECVHEWFEQEGPVPFMEKVYMIRQEKRQLIPAVTHDDGSGRIQSVSKRINPRYYTLIEAFHRLTGVPVLLNTSFNENEPIVNTPEEALNCFLRTRMDLLVIGNHVLERRDVHGEAGA